MMEGDEKQIDRIKLRKWNRREEIELCVLSCHVRLRYVGMDFLYCDQKCICVISVCVFCVRVVPVTIECVRRRERSMIYLQLS